MTVTFKFTVLYNNIHRKKKKKNLGDCTFKVEIGLSPIIMNEVFHFQESDSYSLRRAINLVSRNMHTGHCGSDTASSLGPKLWKLIPDKIKHASTLSAFRANIKYWTINNCAREDM